MFAFSFVSGFAAALATVAWSRDRSVAGAFAFISLVFAGAAAVVPW